ncbi:MAG: hypothetical protein ACPGYM_03750 [Flavobacteriales bacterium]
MKQLASLFLALLTLTATAQINYPFNPDENADAFISTPDLMEFLVVFGYEWEQEEIQVDSIPLSMYLSSLEAMIEASALPEGTMPGQFLQWDGDSWNLVIPKDGCTLPEACNYDPTAHVLDEDKCILQDECGVCDGPGAIYDCGCADIPEGDCDCEGNVVDALGACGGTCAADEDGDGICDDGDSCVGEADECGVCNGPGAIYGCGCSDVPEGACDCAGNVEDILGVCGGGCTADEDGDGICDDEDDCVGEYDGCGVCNGPGPVLGCGCNDIPEGYCDCSGNVLDAVGTCGGACQNDINGDGICDDDSIPGCTYDIACNYDPSASINDGSCDFTSCYGCTDIEACNYSPEATIDNGVCWYAEASYDCEYNCLIDSDGDGVCDDLEIFGCTDEEACNFEPGATELDDSCTYPGCNDETACNFNPEAGCDDGSCEEDGDAGCLDPNACNFDESAICGDASCTYQGCTNPLASNYDEMAGCDDGSCIVYGCTVDLACNYEPTANVEDESCEFGTCPGCTIATDFFFNPTSSNDSLCGTYAEFTNCGASGRFGPTQEQCILTYGNESVLSNSGIQRYTVTYSGVYRIEARGAASRDELGMYGLGASMSGEFYLEQGDYLFILVGQMPNISYQASAPGGGGTFVMRNDIPLIVAGGGGGNTDGNSSGAFHGLTGTAGGASQTGHPGGENGYGSPDELDYEFSCAGQGAGFYGDGGVTVCGSIGDQYDVARAFVNGGVGGQGACNWGSGGFGGGGGSGCSGAGGGGGYSGGAGSYAYGYGGGGGSFNSGSAQVNESGVNPGHGKVVLTRISD